MAKKGNKKIKNATAKSFSEYGSANRPIPASIDLHTHTMRSLDGGLPVRKLLKHTLSNNVKTLAITDHNNIDGVKKALNFIKAEPEKYKDLNLITGVEISCSDPELGARFHLLVYGFDIDNEAFNKKLQEIRKAERAHYYHLFTELEQNFGIKFSPYEIIKASATNYEIGLEAIAKMAVLHVDENGNPSPYAKTPEQFIESVKTNISLNKQFSSKNKSLMVDTNNLSFKDLDNVPYPSLDEILPLIKAAGGVPVLAHPKVMKFDSEREREYSKERRERESERVISAFAKKTDALAMDAGLEVFFGSQFERENYYLRLAKKHDLLISGGSDFHGPHKNNYHRVGTVASRYHLINLPLVDYFNNGRNKKGLYTPRSASECFSVIPKRVKDVYADKNQSIIDNNKLRKASKLQAVLEKFGDQPLPVYKLDERFLQIKKRLTLLESEKVIKDLISKDNQLLSSCEKNKKNCLKNINSLQANCKRFWKLMENFKYLKEKFEESDVLENKEAFCKKINQAYESLTKDHESAKDKRRAMFENYKVNPKNPYDSNVEESENTDKFTQNIDLK